MTANIKWPGNTSSPGVITGGAWTFTFSATHILSLTGLVNIVVDVSGLPPGPPLSFNLPIDTHQSTFAVPPTPGAICVEPDADMWFAHYQVISRLTTAGQLTRYRAPSCVHITAGMDGNLWLACRQEIVRMTPAGRSRSSCSPPRTRSHRALPRDRTATCGSLNWPTSTSDPILESGSDNACAGDQNLIYPLRTATREALLAALTATSGSSSRRSARVRSPRSERSDHRVFGFGKEHGKLPADLSKIFGSPFPSIYSSFSIADQIGRIAPRGTVDLFPVGAYSSPEFIAFGPDGKLWFTPRRGFNRIGAMSTAGAYTEFNLLSPNSISNGIVTGPDGKIWFTEQQANCVVRFVP